MGVYYIQGRCVILPRPAPVRQVDASRRASLAAGAKSAREAAGLRDGAARRIQAAVRGREVRPVL